MMMLLMAFHIAIPIVALSRNQRRSTPSMVRGADSAGYAHHGVRPVADGHEKSHVRKFAAPIAIPRPEDDPGERLLAAAFPEGEHQPADDDRNQRQAPREGAGKGLLEHVHGVEPRAHALREQGGFKASSTASVSGKGGDPGVSGAVA